MVGIIAFDLPGEPGGVSPRMIRGDGISHGMRRSMISSASGNPARGSCRHERFSTMRIYAVAAPCELMR